MSEKKVVVKCRSSRSKLDHLFLPLAFRVFIFEFQSYRKQVLCALERRLR